ncbi:hypothetical protein PI126_g4122 [Phytophthora idaei]|nr:hypothetical protein PI126_g4122 [Phytophthora idaei]
MGSLKEHLTLEIAGFWEKYGHYAPLHIYNVDETGIWYYMHPKRIWALRGKSSKIRSSQKHSALLTAVLTIRADGKTLPVLFIVKGSPNGKIAEEVPLYRKDHAWMDTTVWQRYLRELLRLELSGPSVVLLDNLDCHGSPQSEAIVAGELFATMVPLPPKSTFVCQPLNVSQGKVEVALVARRSG